MTAAPHDPLRCLSPAASHRGTSSLLNRPPPPTGRHPGASRPGTPLGLSVGPEQRHRSQAGPSPPSDPAEPGCAPVPDGRLPPRVGMSRKEHKGPELEVAAGDSPFVGLGRDKPQSEDPDRTEVLPTAPQSSTEAVLDGQASRYFAALDASIRGLQQRTQQLIDKVNDSRKEDHAVMSSFRETLLLKVSGLAEQVEERLFHLYGLHNEQIQERLQELAEVMERVRQAEAELRQVCRTVEAAYHDLCLQPET
ncbi:PREDICTED: synaptonemal complex central element protein 2 [Haliaeetus leucocephalus]|nr:PREDICTED: synaptonemal complex central element protein 2 [Haliaeetus leucocephalus]